MEELHENHLTDECKELLKTVPKVNGWRTPYLYLFQGFWCQPEQIDAILSFQCHFRARDTDIIVATLPRSGTVWLKALVYGIANRSRFPLLAGATDETNVIHPLLTSNPHDLVPFFEYKVFVEPKNNELPDLSVLPNPRIFGTHVSFPSMAESIRSSKCKIVYMSRNPSDVFMSFWVIINKLRPDEVQQMSIDDAFDKFCNGESTFGPFWDHVLGYWKASKEIPEKVMFLKYEEMKEDAAPHLKRLAAFLGSPFSEDEERDGVIEKLVEICSFKTMKELEVNKTGKSNTNGYEYKNLFWKAGVGKGKDHLAPSMVSKLNKVMEDKFDGSGMEFNL